MRENRHLIQLVELFIRLPHAHKISVAAVLCIMSILYLIPTDEAEASRHSEVMVLDPGTRYPLEMELVTVDFAPDDASLPVWYKERVRRGDTLGKLFKRLGFSAKETHYVVNAGQQAKALTSLMPDDWLHYTKNDDGSLQTLKYELTAVKTLLIHKSPDGSYTSTIHSANIETRTHVAQGEIKTSFWNAGINAGLTDAQIMNLAGIFGWDIDFAMEIRKGDTFNIVYETNHVDGELVSYGNIVAAEFINQNDVFQAIRHTDGNYYTPEGRSMRKSFLRAPVDFRYVSSNFTKARFHPVQKRWKAHRGTDYVAAVGTPVVAAGDGKVIKAAYDKYNGHHVFVQHSERYTTKYLHFKKRAVKKGQWVKQGETIGYLGSTGMVTGAHLHYEFLVDGVHRNPRTVSLPKAAPIKASEKSAFKLIAKNRLNELNASKRILITMTRSSASRLTTE